MPPKLWYFIHHRETKEQENLKFLPEEQFFVSLSHGIPPSTPFIHRGWGLVGLFVFDLPSFMPFIHIFSVSTPHFSTCDVSLRRCVGSSGYRSSMACPSFLPPNHPQTRTPSGRSRGEAGPFLRGEECGGQPTDRCGRRYGLSGREGTWSLALCFSLISPSVSDWLITEWARSFL